MVERELHDGSATALGPHGLLLEREMLLKETRSVPAPRETGTI
jgi:hypothetical protein